MLERLEIKNIALIDYADIHFGSKLNVLSGETGSGKSVILDSLNFILGSKADKNMIRYGADEAWVRGEFRVEGNEVLKVLQDLDIETDGEVIITRKYTADGKNSIKINGNTVTAGMLKTLSRHLADVYGQSEHFALLNGASRLALIDGLCGEEAENIKKQLGEIIAQKRQFKKKLSELGGNAAERALKLDMLDYQIKEIDEAKLEDGEEERLAEKKKIIENTQKIASAAGGALAAISGDGGCTDALSAAHKFLNSIAHLSNAYSALAERLEACSSELSDITDELSDITDSLEFDRGEAEYTEERLDLIHSLKKKYGSSVGEIIAWHDRAAQERDLLSDSENAAEKLNADIKKADKKIYDLCLKLTQTRKNHAEKFCGEIEAELKTLNMTGARFKIDFTEYDEANANLDSAEGSDEITFMFTANVGEPLKPLEKVISGGELSRFMLAIKTRLKDLSGVETYVFDEIDAGISGKTATSVAQKFLSVSKYTQVIAVSHLPQICAAAETNFLINKIQQDGSTVTRVTKLEESRKIEEIIRLTGGTDTKAAREHASELITQFRKDT